MRGGGWEIKYDTVLVAETRELLQHSVSEFERACDSMGLEITVGKSKVLTIKNDHVGNCERVRVNGEEMQEEVDKFSYLGGMIIMDVGVGNKVAQRVLEGRKGWGTIAKLRKENMISREVKWKLYETEVIPNVVIKCKREEKNKSV